MNFNNLKRCWIVAEIGVNHEGVYERAADMIRQAAESGADAVKFQTFKAKHYVSTVQPERRARVKKFELTEKQFAALGEEAARYGVTFFSTPLHKHDVDFLQSISPVIKISSGDLTHLALIEHAAGTGLPLMISTGLGTLEEITAAVECVERVRPRARDEGGLLLMHCVAAYPTPVGQANLRNIRLLKDHFGLPVGYSDHTLGIKACELAVAMGAMVIEKHFTYRKENQAFHDHYISAEPVDLRNLVDNIRTAESYLGRYERRRSDDEQKMVQHLRRSLGVVRSLKAGDIINEEDITYLRPAWGLPPEFYERVVGRKLKQNLEAGALIREEDLVP